MQKITVGTSNTRRNKMVIKEYIGSLDLVDEAKLAKVKPKKDKLKDYQNKVNGKKAEDAEKDTKKK